MKQRPPQIFVIGPEVETAGNVLRNIGDSAMLSVATERLARLWPDGNISVLTSQPDALTRSCPSVIPMSPEGRAIWLRPDFLPGRVARRVPKYWPARIRDSSPKAVTMFWRAKLRRDERRLAALTRFTETIDHADLVLLSGMGGITDTFSDYAMKVLDTLNLGLRGRGRIVMVGQGIGPLCDPSLRARAAAILPRLDLILIREKRASAPLLRSLGVDPDRIVVTGDDTVELAYESRQSELGAAIGINLRLSDYSEVEPAALDNLRSVLTNVSTHLDAPLLPAPVSHVPGEADIDSIRRLMVCNEVELERGAEARTPLELIRQIQRCRVMVTGSYHGGVFALANGIPTLGLAKSAYYIDKFQGLADMFGHGCEAIMLKDRDYSQNLESALRRLWEEAPQLRTRILGKAKEQVNAGHAGYRRIQALVAGD